MPRMTSKSTSSKQTRFAKNILPSKISGHCRHALLVTKLLVEDIVIQPHGGNTAITTSDAQIRSHIYYHNPQSLTTHKQNITTVIFQTTHGQTSTSYQTNIYPTSHGYLFKTNTKLFGKTLFVKKTTST